MNKMSTLAIQQYGQTRRQCVNVSDNSARGCVTDSALSGKGTSKKDASQTCASLCVCVCVHVCVRVRACVCKGCEEVNEGPTESNLLQCKPESRTKGPAKRP